jgi:hypothetical protein
VTWATPPSCFIPRRMASESDEERKVDNVLLEAVQSSAWRVSGIAAVRSACALPWKRIVPYNDVVDASCLCTGMLLEETKAAAGLAYKNIVNSNTDAINAGNISRFEVVIL